MASKKEKDDKAKTHKLSLKGSSKLVSEFFDFSIQTLLYQRGVYPPEDFTPTKKYGLTLLVTTDDQVKAYIKKIMAQLSRWMTGGKISKLVVCISAKESGEVVERWEFGVEVLAGGEGSGGKGKGEGRRTGEGKSRGANGTTAAGGGQENSNGNGNSSTKNESHPSASTSSSTPPEKSEAEIQSEIAALFRQITASVTFLPTLDAFGPCTFNVLVYADADSEVPIEWGDSDAREIEGGERVGLRSFETGGHRVGVVVGYKLAE